MDHNDDDINQRRRHRNHLIRAAVAFSTAVVAVAVALESIPRQPYRGESLRGQAETERIIRVSDYTCRDQIRMKRSAFFNLCELIKDRGLFLRDSLHVSMEEKLCMFLNTIGHNTKNRQLVHNFGRSGQTVFQYVNEALNAIIKLYPRCSQKKGKKVGPVAILVDPLRELAAAIKSSTMLSDEIEAAKMVNETVAEMFKNDSFDKKAAATIFLMDHKWATKTLFSTPKEERVALLEAIMRSTTSTP